MAPPIFQVPFELIEKIVGYLRGDHSSLRRISLVNKSFSEACQRLLFKKIILKINPDPFIVHHKSARAKELKEVLMESPRLRPLIRGVRLDFASPMNTIHREPYSKDPEVPRLLDFLGPLSRLELSGPSSYFIYIWSDIPKGLLDAIYRRAQSHSLKSLYISNCRQFSITFFAECKDLDQLDLAHVTFGDLASSEVDVTLRANTLILKGIVFPGAQSSTWRFFTPKVRTLKGVVYQGKEFISLKRLIQAGSETLEEVRIRLEGGLLDSPPIVTGLEALSGIRNLRKLEFTAHLWSGGPRIPWFFRMLAHTDLPPTVESIVFSLIFTNGGLKWEEPALMKTVDKLLVKACTRNLKMIDFRLFCDIKAVREEMEGKIYESMMSLFSNCLARVTKYNREDWVL